MAPVLRPRPVAGKHAPAPPAPARKALKKQPGKAQAAAATAEPIAFALESDHIELRGHGNSTWNTKEHVYFSHSARNVVKEGCVLTAQLQTRAGDWRTSSIHVCPVIGFPCEAVSRTQITDGRYGQIKHLLLTGFDDGRAENLDKVIGNINGVFEGVLPNQAGILRGA